MSSRPLAVGVLLFPDFELLDACGPLEVLGHFPARFTPLLVGPRPGLVASVQGVGLAAAHGLADCPPLDVLLVPGGPGTRREVANEQLLAWLRGRAGEARLVASVCTGAALLARAGVLDGRRATSNKRAWDWVVAQGPEVQWIRRARWVEDGRFWTSSGVSAGLDMTLEILSRQLGRDAAEDEAWRIEYGWQRDPGVDPFADPRPKAPRP